MHDLHIEASNLNILCSSKRSPFLAFIGKADDIDPFVPEQIDPPF